MIFNLSIAIDKMIHWNFINDFRPKNQIYLPISLPHYLPINIFGAQINDK